MFEIRRYRDSDKYAWNNFVKLSKQGTFLFDRAYMEYHRKRFNDDSLMFFKSNKLYAVLPANIVGDTLWSHQGLTYGGLITNEHATTAEVCALFEELMSFLENMGVKRMIYKPMPWIYQRLPAEEDLYALFNRCKARLYVRNVSSVIMRGNALKWRRIRQFGANKAIKTGIGVEVDKDALDEFWPVLENNLHRTYNAKPVHSLEEIQYLHDAFPEDIRLYVARLGNNLIGGVLLYITPQVVHAQYISATEEGKKLHAIDAIFHKILMDDFHGYKYFDFGTSNEDMGRYLNESLIYQKEGFGGRAVCYDWYEVMINR